MTRSPFFLGIDIGSVAVSLVELNEQGDLLRSAYTFHHGRIDETLSPLLEGLDPADCLGIASAGAAHRLLPTAHRFNGQLAVLAAARHFHPDVRSILVVGGEKFSLIRLDERGRFIGCKSNSSCAAGTGSFLDQQAGRLRLRDSAALSALAESSKEEMARIATRCAVFAKTDLIHAQQAGYGIGAICNGLCHGMATNVADVLFGGDRPAQPIVLTGGVACNQAFVRHIEALTGCDFRVDPWAHLYGAIGSALLLAEQGRAGGDRLAAVACAPEPPPGGDAGDCRDLYPPLELSLSTYPDFAGLEQYRFDPVISKHTADVEVDIYTHPDPAHKHGFALGVDIGSTSTKSVLVDGERNVVAGFYTRTSGRPLSAMQALLEATDHWLARRGIQAEITAAATTGSGRKFIGGILGADLVVDEITAHARAACELDPEVDTIIEIGGQDAKFTTLRRGTVTFSMMNNVCAAGTGSFIEEQAHKLGCTLQDFDRLTRGVAAPMVSERCTVFMERDMNHYLSNGCSVPEVLTAVLHSVRENYLSKVTRESMIGRRVCFQGATAKNRALVAAFEQKLGRPIHVSRYCHLTGALGAAYLAMEQARERTAFHGLSLFEKDVPVRTEVCALCTNHCKLTVAEIQGETVACGFLCGRDYQQERFVSSNRSGVDLVKTYRKHLAAPTLDRGEARLTLGIPAALYLLEELPFWKGFFRRLGVRVVTSENLRGAVSAGKKLTGAEFCAPMAAFHAHVASLADRCDKIFIPTYLEARDIPKGVRRQYCYYSQFGSALALTIHRGGLADKCLWPLVNEGNAIFPAKARLYAALRPLLGKDLTLRALSAAFDASAAEAEGQRAELRRLYTAELQRAALDDVSVCLLGRPYTVLTPDMNHSIPDIFAAQGIRVYYQGMVTPDPQASAEIGDLLKALPWSYAATILETAATIARTPGMYPVFLTSFMCTPDSCILDLFRGIMDQFEKPYLVLQLDEHDSTMGYETRVEAAVRTFRNHRRQRAEVLPHERGAPYLAPAFYKTVDRLAGRTVLIPNWDPLACRLLAANLRREGYDARVLVETEKTIHKGLTLNTGQCLPMSCIAQSTIQTIAEQGLDPAKTTLWCMRSKIACNLGMASMVLKNMFNTLGGGMERVELFAGDMVFVEFPLRTSFNTYFAFLFTGFLRRMACRTRPYEKHRGQTDAAVAASLDLWEQTFERDLDKQEALRAVLDRFQRIEVTPGRRPKVALFGDLYTRDNDTMNQGVVRMIEAHGAEVLPTPYTDYIKIVAGSYLRKWFREGKYMDVVAQGSILAAIQVLERKFTRRFEEAVGGKPAPRAPFDPEKVLKRFHLTDHHTGESVDNLLKVFYLLNEHSDLSLFVQLNPSYCCPSLVTEAQARAIEAETGIPVVTLTYDGTPSPKNDVLIPYLHSLSCPGDARRGAKLDASA